MTDTSRRPFGQGSLVEAARVARRFYLDGQQKSRIAQELGMSRFKVARLLDLAREAGVVQITVNAPSDVDLELGERLAAERGLRRAIVARTDDSDPDAISAAVGRSGAEHLTAVLGSHDVLGMAWGASLTAVAHAMPPGASGADVVQIVGGVRSSGPALSGVEIVRRVAQRTGGRPFPLHAPLVVGSAEMANDLRGDASLSDVIARFGELTVAVFGIGAWDPPRSALFDELPHDQRADLRAEGVVADVCGIPIDRGGSIVRTDLAGRVVGVTFDELREVPEVIAVSGGRSKAAAVDAALRTGLITTLVTDASTAEELLR